MKILVSNDDGYNAKGIRTLVRLLRNYGEVTVVAPKKAQSGMSMAVTMGYAPIAVKHIGMEDGADWWYLDGTPASCVKFGIDNIFWPDKPDLVVSGINHGNNAATAALYSGTIGAAMAVASALNFSKEQFKAALSAACTSTETSPAAIVTISFFMGLPFCRLSL